MTTSRSVVLLFASYLRLVLLYEWVWSRANRKPTQEHAHDWEPLAENKTHVTHGCRTCKAIIRKVKRKPSSVIEKGKRKAQRAARRANRSAK